MYEGNFVALLVREQQSPEREVASDITRFRYSYPILKVYQYNKLIYDVLSFLISRTLLRIDQPPEFKKLAYEIVNKTLNNIPLTTEELKSLVAAPLGPAWIKLHPESVDIPTNITSLQQLIPGLSPEIANNQKKVGDAWLATNWSGACGELAKLAKPTLVIAGTDDNYNVPHGNALILAGKIPGA